MYNKRGTSVPFLVIVPLNFLEILMMNTGTAMNGRGIMFFGGSTLNVIANAIDSDVGIYCGAFDHNIVTIGDKNVTIFGGGKPNGFSSFRAQTGGGDDLFFGTQEKGTYIVENLKTGNGDDTVICSREGYLQVDLGGGNDRALVRNGTLYLGTGADELYVAVDQFIGNPLNSQYVYVEDFSPKRLVLNDGHQITIGDGDTINLSMFTSIKREDMHLSGNELVCKIGPSINMYTGLPFLTERDIGTDGSQLYTPEIHIAGVGDAIRLMGGIDAAINLGVLSVYGSYPTGLG
jgi:hypothetical protein